MTDSEQTGAIGEGSDPRTMVTDPNGARTAVGTKHPENRQPPRHLDMDALQEELSDYDDEKVDDIATIPPDRDAGRSFSNIVDVGEVSDDGDLADGARTSRPAQRRGNIEAGSRMTDETEGAVL